MLKQREEWSAVLQVEVADDVLTAQPNGFSEFPGRFTGWRGDVCFLISPLPSSGDGDLPKLAAAAQAALDRFQFVTGQGVELAGAWAVSDDDVPTGFVGPSVFEDGVVVGAGGEDGIWPPQAATMLQIVLDELHSRNIGARVSCPPRALNGWNLPAWLSTDDSRSNTVPADRPDSEKRWHVLRSVRAITTTGVRYDDREWLQHDRTWSRDPAGAIKFDDTPDGRAEATRLVVSLREEADAAGGDPRHGEVNGVLTSADAEDRSWPLPPDRIRDHGTHVGRSVRRELMEREP
jgi:hypothetical protein